MSLIYLRMRLLRKERQRNMFPETQFHSTPSQMSHFKSKDHKVSFPIKTKAKKEKVKPDKKEKKTSD